MPLFPELLPHFEYAFERAEPRAEFVIGRYRSQNINLRTQLHRIIRRAGLEPWEKLWQNLRSTRETELAEQFPLHVVCRWIGNSQPVAAKHYLQVTDEYFPRAVRGDAESDAGNGQSDVKARQNPTLHSAAANGTEVKKLRVEAKVMDTYSSRCDFFPVRSSAINQSAPSRTRTLNLLIKSQLLCQLS